MRVGLSAYNLGARELVDLAEAADELGFDTLWLGEHVLRPVGSRSEHPTHGSAAHQHHSGPIVEPETELVDPLVALGAAAARTSRLRLATGIYVLPLRHPILTARAAATLHELSRGRFLLGIGVGWLREEFDALGIPFAGRGAWVEEAVTVLRSAWEGGPFSHSGSRFELGPMQITSRPTPVPIVLGGNSEVALERAAKLGDAWFSSGTPAIDEAVALAATVRDRHRTFGRVGDLRCYVRIASAEPDLVAEYRNAGLDDVVVWADQVWQGEDLEARRESLRQCATRLGLVTAT
jgi:probable F420-dependent oxidoreductase